MVRAAGRVRFTAVLLLSSLALVTACRDEPTPTPAPSPTAAPTPSPDDEITAAAREFRTAAAELINEAAEAAEVNVNASGLAAASAAGGSTLVVSALVDGIADLSEGDLVAGADLALTFLPATTSPQLEAGPYLVRILRDPRRVWKAQLVDLEGNTAGEVNASVETGDAEDSAEGCRVFLERAARRVGGGVECPTFVASWSLDETLPAQAGDDESGLRDRMASANDELRASVRTALCAEAREWRITDCPTAFVVGSRDDSLVVSGPLVEQEDISLSDMRSGFDSAFVFLQLPSGVGVPTGFGLLRLSSDDSDAWRTELRARDGRVVFEPTVTVNQIASTTDTTEGDERYVSYVDTTVVCTDHEYEEVDVGTGQSVTVVEVTCYSRSAADESPAPTVSPQARQTPRPTRRPTPRPTVRPTATPTASPTASPTPPPTPTPEPAPTPTPV